MSNSNAYDISSEIDPIERVDEIQARLKQRRRERDKSAGAKTPEPDSTEGNDDGQPAEDHEADKAAESKRRAAEAAKKKREMEQQRRDERQQELRESRWITAGHKVREKRVEHLERVYYRLKAEGEFAGNKQEFFDEGLALLEEKYGSRGDLRQ